MARVRGAAQPTPLEPIVTTAVEAARYWSLARAARATSAETGSAGPPNR